MKPIMEMPPVWCVGECIYTQRTLQALASTSSSSSSTSSPHHRGGQEWSFSHLWTWPLPSGIPTAIIFFAPPPPPAHRNNFSCKLDLFGFFALRIKCRKCCHSPLIATALSDIGFPVIFPTFDKLSSAWRMFNYLLIPGQAKLKLQTLRIRLSLFGHLKSLT